MSELQGYVRFTGKFDRLKFLGYKFQKLFAGNYMQWSKCGFRVWKRGSDITHDAFDLYKLIKFLDTEPIVMRSGSGIGFYKFYSDSESNEYDYYPMNDENKQRYSKFLKSFSNDDYDSRNPPFYLGDTIFINADVLAELDNLKKLDLYVLSFHPSEN